MPVTSKNCHAFPNDDNQKLMYTHPHKKKGGGFPTYKQIS